MLKALIDAYKKHLIYRQTYKELSRLTKYELKDLGIHGTSLYSIAYAAAYGKEKGDI